MLSVTFSYCYAECWGSYDECYYVECHYAVSLCWVSLCWVLLCWGPSCWVPLCWVSLCWVSVCHVLSCWVLHFLIAILNDIKLSVIYAECRYAECRYAGCRGAFKIFQQTFSWRTLKNFTHEAGVTRGHCYNSFTAVIYNCKHTSKLFTRITSHCGLCCYSLKL
jgi:hypothetical protein